MMGQGSEQIKQALLVIDVQQGLFERSIPIYKEEELLGNINSLIDKARQADVPVIFIQHSNEGSLKFGTDVWKLHPEIQPLADEIIIHKQQGNAFAGTNLQDELKQRGVEELLITGLVTHGCVKATSLGSLGKGYKTVLVSDAHSNFSEDAPGMIEKWNQVLREKGAELVRTQDVNFRG